MKRTNTKTLPKGAYIPLSEYARQMKEPYATLYGRIRAGRAGRNHYQVGRARLVRVAS